MRSTLCASSDPARHALAVRDAETGFAAIDRLGRVLETEPTSERAIRRPAGWIRQRSAYYACATVIGFNCYST